MKKTEFSRRKALAGLGSIAAASAVTGQELMKEPPGRIAPRQDLVNVLEFEDMAARKLPPQVYSSIAGGDRSFFERMTFRPRMNVPTTDLDLSVDLFGKMFAPILVGPMAHQQNFHPDGELAMVRGASAAKAVMVVSSDSSQPIEKIAAESKTDLWFQIDSGSDAAAAHSRIQQAVKSGCKAVCITVGAPSSAGAKNPTLNWSVIDQIRQGISVPIVIKGIMSPQEADAAVKKGVQGIVVSNYGGLLTPGLAPPMEMLPPIIEAVGGKVPVLIDGSFRRGSDILKALAFGAKAVLVGRPVVWGLAAYGADGVQSVLEMLQTELARVMCMCGNPNLKSIPRTVVKVHEV